MKLMWPRLRFDSPEDEACFMRETQPARLRHFFISGCISLLVYNGFLLVDWLVAPDVFMLGVVVRLGLFTSFGLTTILFHVFFKEVVLAISPWVAEGMIVVTGVMAGLSMAVVLMSPHMGSSVWAVFYHAGFVPVIIYGNLVQRLRFGPAVVFTGSVLLVHWVCMAHVDRHSPELIVPMLMFVSSIAGYSLLINWRMEHEERQQFSQQLRARALRAQLDQTRHQLEMASRRDPLTGVANRRGFDAVMDEAWQGAQREGQGMALMLVDVDHFKAYNDFYGHPAGDECLRHVAAELQRQISEMAPAGLVARWGGEEFVILLPDMAADPALARAQCVVQGVQAVGLRHERSPTAATVTVSVGLAAAARVMPGDSWPDLLAGADAALYDAKRQGRNRVVTMGAAVAALAAEAASGGTAPGASRPAALDRPDAKVN